MVWPKLGDSASLMFLRILDLKIRALDQGSGLSLAASMKLLSH